MGSLWKDFLTVLAIIAIFFAAAVAAGTLRYLIYH